MENTVLFVRTGESHDTVLTDVGGIQSRCVAKHITDMMTRHNIKTVNIYSSSEHCTIDTAICLVNKWDIPLNIRIPGYSSEYSKYSDTLLNTIMSEFDAKLKDASQTPIIVYTNDKFINAILNSLNKTPENIEYCIHNCSISTIVYNTTSKEWNIECVSDISHLGDNITH